jgi:hypothetical protein
MSSSKQIDLERDMAGCLRPKTPPPPPLTQCIRIKCIRVEPCRDKVRVATAQTAGLKIPTLY